MVKLKHHYQTITTDVIVKTAISETGVYAWLHDIINNPFIEAYYNTKRIKCKTTPTQFLYVKYRIYNG